MIYVFLGYTFDAINCFKFVSEENFIWLECVELLGKGEGESSPWFLWEKGEHTTNGKLSYAVIEKGIFGDVT